MVDGINDDFFPNFFTIFFFDLSQLFVQPAIYGPKGRQGIIDNEFKIENTDSGSQYNVTVVGIDDQKREVGAQSEMISFVTRELLVYTRDEEADENFS